MLSKQQYQEWIEDPTTQEVLRYLSDFAEAMDQELLVAIRSGRVVSEEDQRVHQAKKVMVQDLAELEFEDIERFYAEPTTEQ